MLYVYQEKNIKTDIPKIANKFAKKDLTKE